MGGDEVFSNMLDLNGIEWGGVGGGGVGVGWGWGNIKHVEFTRNRMGWGGVGWVEMG